jgi:plastocyanin
LLALLAASPLPAVAGATTEATKDVRVTDAALDPVQVEVAVGDSVRWRNLGTRAHTVVSDSGAWTAFTLKRGRTKIVRFREAGCFRYKVDGRVRGRVAVAASCASGGGGGGGGGQSPGETKYRYDITVTGRAHTVQRHSGDEPGIYDNNGTVDVDLAWKSTYRNVALKKVSSGADSFVLTNAGGLFGRGATDLKFTYNHARQNSLGPCKGSFSLAALASRVRVAGYRGAGLGNQFGFGSQMLLGPSATLAKRIDAACEYSDEPRWIEFQGSPEPDIVRGGLTWHDVDPIIGLSVDVERKSSRSFSPLTRLAEGAGFTIQTGPIRNQGPCHFGSLARVCTETFEGFLVVKFVPRRP